MGLTALGPYALVESRSHQSIVKPKYTNLSESVGTKLKNDMLEKSIYRYFGFKGYAKG